MKQEEFPCTGKLPYRAQRGAVESQKTGQSTGLEGTKQRKLHFSAHKEHTDVSPPRQHAQGTKGKPTVAPQHRGQAQGAERGVAYKLL